MPDPRQLQVDDLVRFVSLPEEWEKPGYQNHRDTISFMKRMIRRTWPSRVFEVDDWGYPWIHARILRWGRIEYHAYCITEKTGWRMVRRSHNSDRSGNR